MVNQSQDNNNQYCFGGKQLLVVEMCIVDVTQKSKSTAMHM